MAFNNDSSQSEHPRSLIKVFAVSMKKLCIWIPAGSSKDIIQAKKKFKNAISVSILYTYLIFRTLSTISAKEKLVRFFLISLKSSWTFSYDTTHMKCQIYKWKYSGNAKSRSTTFPMPQKKEREGINNDKTNAT